MLQSTMQAYAEVDTILDLMDLKYLKEIPSEIRDRLKEKKDKEYYKEIVPNKPLEEQNLKQETLNILASLNYNYWCKDENHKKELMHRYTENEKKHQEELMEKYNPDNLFKNVKKENEQTVNENLAVLEQKETFWNKFIKKIKSIFKK